MRVFSYGGGVQSTAALVLAAQGKIDYPTFLFANVGEDSEDPATIDFVRNVAMPYGKEHGIEVLELKRHKRDGSVETLWGRLTKEGARSLPIPVYFSGGVPGRRACTADFKIRVIDKWHKAHGASEENPVTVGLGISTDEIQRAKSDSGIAHQILDYPLLTLGLNRDRCLTVIREAGLPEPGKSACFFCPYHRLDTWRELERDKPELFHRAVDLERQLNVKRDLAGKEHVFLTKYKQPLDKVILEDYQDSLFDGIGKDGCDSGNCFV